jgi:type I restriction enzyme, S subunit
MAFPAEWTEKKFEDVATLQRGKDLPKQFRGEGSFPILGSNGICGYHSEFVSEGPGVVTERSGSIGGSYYVDERFWPLNTALWVKDFHGNLPLFVHYFFQSFDFLRFKAGVSVPTLNRNLFSNEPVTVPPLPEQRSIATVLAKIQEAIAAQQEIIDRTRELKKALMGKLFSEGLKGEPTKETEIGPVPTSWEIKCLREVGGFINALNFAQDARGEGVPFVNVKDIYAGLYLDTTSLECVNMGVKNLSKYYLQNGDVLFVRSSLKEEGVGWAATCLNLNEPTVFCGFLIRFRPNIPLGVCRS